MRAIFVASMALALASCGKTVQGEAVPDADSTFPEKGEYHVVHDVMQGNESKREEADTDLDLSSEAKFAEQLGKDDGSNCRDKQVTIKGGSFSVHMVCDAPDGDIHNIGLDRRGTYSRDSIDMTVETTLWGMPFRETYSYRLTGHRS